MYMLSLHKCIQLMNENIEDKKNAKYFAFEFKIFLFIFQLMTLTECYKINLETSKTYAIISMCFLPFDRLSSIFDRYTFTPSKY